MSPREYLSSILPSREEVDRFLARTGADGLQPNRGWTYDAELGWIHADAVHEADGVARGRTFYHYEPDGARRVLHGRDEPSRIHAYGDSFTHCDQVNDGETWQEFLAAHLREPVRNYGVGGYSVYQAYRRMLKVEREGLHRAQYVILMIYDDDHFRTLDSWRRLRSGRGTVCGFTLPYLRVNLAAGACRECENLLARPEEVYQLCDPEWVWQTFGEDPVLALALAMRCDGEASRDLAAMAARGFGLGSDLPGEESGADAARRLHVEAALLATRHVLELTERFIQKTDKRLMVILAFTRGTMAAALRGEPPFDAALLEYLHTRPYPVIDMRDAFREDFRRTHLDERAYLDAHYNGHLTPWGNLFTAWSIKDRVVEWLEPRPAPYWPARLLERGAAPYGVAPAPAAAPGASVTARGAEVVQYLETLVPSREEVEAFVEPPGPPPWLSRNHGVTHDPLLGWAQSRAILLDGVGGCGAFYDYEPDGARRVIHGAGQPCRIYTFGDSFTHGDQVSDGETWQEFLAAHLQEPIRNHGVGGYSVYQAFLRMRQLLQTHRPAHVILNIYEHDHTRSLTAFWGISFGRRVRCGFTCPGVRVNAAADRCTPFENLFPSPTDVYQLCDRDFVVETFRDDPTLPVHMVRRNRLAAVPALVERVAADFGLALGTVAGLEPRRAIDRLFNEAALYATRRVLGMVEPLTEQAGARLMVVLSHSQAGVAAALRGEAPWDQSLLDYLRTRPYPVIDMRDAFASEFRHSRLTPEEYLAPYYCGHHSPLGNAFTAWALKEPVVRWLDPRPAPYAAPSEAAQ